MSDTRDQMQDVARAVESILPPHTGFIVLAFDHDKPGQVNPIGRIDYVSNSERADCCRAMMDFVKRTAEGFGEHELERLLTRHVELGEEECRLICWAMENSGVGPDHPTLHKFK